MKRSKGGMRRGIVCGASSNSRTNKKPATMVRKPLTRLAMRQAEALTHMKLSDGGDDASSSDGEVEEAGEDDEESE